jgi:hypothetical protein
MSTQPVEGLNLADTATYGYRAERWNFVEGEALAGIVTKLNKEQNRYVINPATSRVVWRTLPFYPGATLLRVTDLSWRPFGLTSFFVGLRGDYRRMDGARRFIRFLNEKLPLKLSSQNVIDYLRFYSFFVRDNGRPFLLVEKAEDLGEFEPVPTPEQLSLLSQHLAPITLTNGETAASNPTQDYLITATVRFSNALFAATFSVSRTGSVKMIECKALPGTLPVSKAIDTAPVWAK